MTGAPWSPPSLLPSWESGLGGEALPGGLEPEQRARRAGAENYYTDLGEAEPCAPQAEWPLRGWDGHGPQTVPTCWAVLGGHSAKVGFAEPRLFSGRLLLGCCILPLAGEHL